jgi:GGDEF domain-containing protein
VGSETKTLIRICNRRFHSFSEAAESVLGALADDLPGVVLLGQIDPDEPICRVLDAQGTGVEGVHKDATLPLAFPAGGTTGGAAGPAPDSELDRAFLGSLGVKAWFEVPLEMSDGRIVGILAALDSQPDAYRSEHIAMLGIAARLLSYEWESVERRAELRRLRSRLSAGAEVDPETGLLSREVFLSLLDREWNLAERGTVESVVVVFRIKGGTADGTNGAAISRLALKTAAEVLEASVRTTDRAGRVGDMALAAALVGCSTDQAPIFAERFRAALGRVTRDGNLRIELSHGIQALGETSSAEEALGRADVAAGISEQTSEQVASPQPAYQGAVE